jgi:flagellar basal body-associated protein FliL
MADEKTNEIETEKNKPVKSKEKKEDGIPLVLMIGGALGGVVMIIVSVIIGTIIANKLFPPQIGTAVVEEEHTTTDGKGHHKKLEPFPEDNEIEGTISLLEDSDWLTFDSCKIQTNVKSPAGMIGIIDVAVSYKPHYVEELTIKGFLQEPGVDGHGNPTSGGANKESTLYKKLKLNVSSALLGFIGSHTADELQNMQSNGTLSDSLKVNLKQPFKDIGLIVGKVDITSFIIARM